jgi:DNA polymerase III subunit delta
MVALKASAVQRFVRSPDPGCRAVLIYGPDAGLVTERAVLMQKHFTAAAGEAEIIRLDDRDLAQSEGRLEIELRTLPMFAARKVVRVSAEARLDPEALKALLAEPPEAALIVEAGNLRPDSALRKLFEASAFAAALPCYGDESSVASAIDEELRANGLSIDRETRAYLMSRLGADQALSRGEVAKLALYAAGKGAVTLEDVEAVVGDSAEIAVVSFVDLVSGGNGAEAIRQLARLDAAGVGAQAALGALARHFTQLHGVAASLAEGATPDTALRALRPPPHFKRREEFLRQCRRWGPRRLLAATPPIREAMLKARLSPDLATAHAERLVLALTRASG